MANIDNIQEIVQILIGLEEGNDSNIPFSPLISMVPSMLRDLSPNSFNPRVVSIGPLHCKDENLQAFQGRKVTYMHDLLRRFDSPLEDTLTSCVEKVNASIHRIRKCYAGLMEPYGDIELAKMMVIDGCFILEFIQKFSEGVINALIAQSIHIDLLLVENQIPFFVLNYIFECTILASEPTASLTNIILPFLEVGNLFDCSLKIEDIDANTIHDHILGLLHKCYQPTYALPSGFSSSTIHSVVELDRAGVNFKPNRDANWPMAMKMEYSKFPCISWFWVKPTLRMPTLYIHEFTELRLRNLIAYEQSFLVRNYVTSYAETMDILLDTPKDIAKLVESKSLSIP